MFFPLSTFARIRCGMYTYYRWDHIVNECHSTPLEHMFCTPRCSLLAETPAPAISPPQNSLLSPARKDSISFLLRVHINKKSVAVSKKSIVTKYFRSTSFDADRKCCSSTFIIFEHANASNCRTRKQTTAGAADQMYPFVVMTLFTLDVSLHFFRLLRIIQEW